jgi:cellulose synthase/poly-beta-1,6-N-acetylglucosamine synthase-like glycosyltransferase
MVTPMQWIESILLLSASLILLPVGVVCVECIASLLPKRKPRALKITQPARDPLVILIPAHDEESCVADTLRSVKSQLGAGDQILLVADNCIDHTAQIAREIGAEVIERTAPFERGKGRALAFGIEHLKKSPISPRIVIIIDADCTLKPGAIDALVAQTLATSRPVQAIYLLENPKVRHSSQTLLSSMAFLVRNGVRPSGASRLGIPCLLTGSGMAFPWHALVDAKLGDGNLVEDMQLGLDLTVAGWPPSLCEKARVMGRIIIDTHAARTQRTRWEHGHLRTIFLQVPRLIAAGLRQGKIAPIALALDLCVPPLSLLAIFALLTALATAGMALFSHGSWRPAEILLGGAVVLFFSLTIGCARFGRPLLPTASALALPAYLWWKLPIFLAFISHRQTDWIRTPRTPEPPAIPVEMSHPVPAPQKPSRVAS